MQAFIRKKKLTQTKKSIEIALAVFEIRVFKILPTLGSALHLPKCFFVFVIKAILELQSWLNCQIYHFKDVKFIWFLSIFIVFLSY